MDLIKAIRIKALHVVLFPDREYLIRRALRWYSKTFSTPLREVEELPLEDVFRAYYEEKYGAMSEEELDREREELLVTDQQRYEQALAEEAEEADLFEMAKIVAAEEAANKKKRMAMPSTDKLAEIQHETPGPIASHEMPVPVLGELPKELPPDITMTFVSDADFEAELEGLGAMDQPRKP